MIYYCGKTDRLVGTAPTQQEAQALLREIYAKAKLDPSSSPCIRLRQSTLPLCTSSQATALERCIQDIKAKGDASVNPWATCQSSIGCTLPHKQPATQEEEDQRFMDALVEALKKEGKLDA